MGRIQNTVELAKASWRVLQADRELAWLPVISGVISLAVLAVMAVVAGSTGALETTQGETDPMVAVLGLVTAAAVAVIVTFFQSALVAGAHERLTGGDPTVSGSMGAASSKMHRIIPWALLNLTVGMILRSLRERAGFLGALIGWLGETAWNLLTYLAVPVLVLEDVGPIDTVRRSSTLFKRTWGENVAAQMGFGLLGFVAVIPALLVGGLMLSAGGVVAFVGVVIAVAYIAVVAVVLSALNGIFQTALYMYAAEGVIPGPFQGTNLPATFR